MKTNLFILFFLIFIIRIANAHVGIGETAPKATLDVKGKPTNASTVDGIISPRLTGDELKAKDAACGADNTGAMVYLTSAAAPRTANTINVVSEGYYYFDGTVWQRMTSKPSNLTTLQMNAISDPLEGMEIYNRDAKCNFFYDGTDWRSQCTKINQAANPVNFQLTGTTGTAASQILSVTFNSPWKARVSIKASAIHNAWTNTRDENIASNASVFLNSTANTALTSANSRYQNTFQLVHMHSTKLLWSMEVQPGDHTQVERTACNIDMNVSSQTLVVDVK